MFFFILKNFSTHFRTLRIGRYAPEDIIWYKNVVTSGIQTTDRSLAPLHVGKPSLLYTLKDIRFFTRLNQNFKMINLCL